MADLTLLLGAIQRGEPEAANALLTQVYEELRQMARAKMTRAKPNWSNSATSSVSASKKPPKS